MIELILGIIIGKWLLKDDNEQSQLPLQNEELPRKVNKGKHKIVDQEESRDNIDIDGQSYGYLKDGEHISALK